MNQGLWPYGVDKVALLLIYINFWKIFFKLLILLNFVFWWKTKYTILMSMKSSTELNYGSWVSGSGPTAGLILPSGENASKSKIFFPSPTYIWEELNIMLWCPSRYLRKSWHSWPLGQGFEPKEGSIRPHT